MEFIPLLFLFFAFGNTIQIDLRSTENEPITALKERQKEGRIANGYEAAPKDFPYMVGLRQPYSNSGCSCAGAIISDRWILTAAHCIKDLNPGIEVYLGAWKCGNLSEPGQFRVVVHRKNIIKHANYELTFGQFGYGADTYRSLARVVNDIALIKLPIVIKFNEYVQHVNLPKKAEAYLTYSDQMVVVPGWGEHLFNEHHDKDILRWSPASVLPNYICKLYIDQDLITSRHICLAGGDVSTVCIGDSGGPIVLPDRSYTLIAIISFGYTVCGREGPTAGTRITSYLDWIEENTGLKNN